jgi:type VI secretion system protein ImpK
VLEDANKVRVRLQNLFASGRADLDSTVVPGLRCLATVLRDVPGRLMIVGHTDNQPIDIAHAAAFPNNWELSKARAEAVARVFRSVMNSDQRLAVEGRADTEPIASNDDETGRSQNRRVEVMLLR